MATAAPPPTSPPDEAFWTKYSPNQEMPISGLGSLGIHLLAVALMLGLFFVISSSRDSSMPVETISLGDDGNAGGGGDPNGVAISNVKGQPRIERATADEMPADAPTPTTALAPLPDVRSDLIDLPVRPDADRSVNSSDAKAALNKLARAGASGPPQSAGQGGSGSGGGKGAGAGTGEGAGEGAGTAGSIRARRNKRWTLSFSTHNDNDYLKQLNALGATLVGEFSDGNRVMYRRLDVNPVPAEPFDPQLRQQMVWVDERPNFVNGLSAAMGLATAPNAMRAYFPVRLEAELLQLELAFRGFKEEQIHSTTFQVFLQGGGYKLIVSQQKLN